MARRGHGEGTIYGVNKDGRKVQPGEKPVKFVGILSLGYPSGKRKRKKVTEPTYKAVQAKLRALQKLHDHGVDLTRRPPTVGAYLAEWFERDYVPQHRNKHNSLNTYRSALFVQIIPRIGHIRLDKLTRAHVTDMLNAMGAEHFALNTMKLVRYVLIQALTRAEYDGLIHKNYAREARVPQVPQANHATRALTVEQLQAVTQALEHHRLALAIRLAYTLGLRRGEICALRWADLDLEARKLTVSGTIVFVKGRGCIRETPKTKTSLRTLTLNESLVTAFQWHKSRQDAERKLMGNAWEQNDYVFVRETTGKAVLPNSLYTILKSILHDLGMPHFRLHDLRHTVASCLRQQGYDVAQISKVLGHARISTTLDVYMHLFEHDTENVADAIDDLLNTTPRKAGT